MYWDCSSAVWELPCSRKCWSLSTTVFVSKLAGPGTLACCKVAAESEVMRGTLTSIEPLIDGEGTEALVTMIAGFISGLLGSPELQSPDAPVFAMYSESQFDDPVESAVCNSFKFPVEGPPCDIPCLQKRTGPMCPKGTKCDLKSVRMFGMPGDKLGESRRLSRFLTCSTPRCSEVGNSTAADVAMSRRSLCSNASSVLWDPPKQHNITV